MRLTNDISSLRCYQKPYSLVEIGSHAFYGCVSLKSVVIPSSVEGFYYEAFANCTSLQDVQILGEFYEGYSQFKNCPSLNKIIVPKSLERLYKEHLLRDYKDYIVGI